MHQSPAAGVNGYFARFLATFLPGGKQGRLCSTSSPPQTRKKLCRGRKKPLDQVRRIDHTDTWTNDHIRPRSQVQRHPRAAASQIFDNLVSASRSRLPSGTYLRLPNVEIGTMPQIIRSNHPKARGHQMPSVLRNRDFGGHTLGRPQTSAGRAFCAFVLRVSRPRFPPLSGYRVVRDQVFFGKSRVLAANSSPRRHPALRLHLGKSLNGTYDKCGWPTGGGAF